MANPIILTPSEGKWLTQANLTNEDERIFSDMIFLGIHDKASNYIEWTDAQKQAWEDTHLPVFDDDISPE